MKLLKRFSPHAKSGFTLIEILIVAALISLFSGLAIISMDYLATQSKRKAAVVDARAISDALTIAHFEFGVYPKISYLSRPVTDIRRVVGNQVELIPDFDYIGFSSQEVPVLRARYGRILESWNGPYLPSPEGRGVVTAGGVIRMRMPHQPASTPSSELFPWPADPWGRPYVLYLVTVDDFGSPMWCTSPTDTPDYFARVVSYGPNGIPGGGEQIGRGLSPGDLQDLRAAGAEYALYKAEDEGPFSGETGRFVALRPEEYEVPVNRLIALRRAFGYMNEPRFSNVPGIMDPGSDDLSVPLH